MASRDKIYGPRPQNTAPVFPFESVEEAWFWFMAAMQARNEGARFATGRSWLSRPCEPGDILKIVDRLVRNRRLLKEHLLVMRHYGRRFLRPDESRVKEARAHSIWTEAMERLGEALESKGIVETKPMPFWGEEVSIFMETVS